MAWAAPRTWVAGAVLTAAQLNTDVRDNELILKTPINDSGHLSFVDATELTIAAGVITVTQNYHKVDTQADASTDDLDTITPGTDVAAGFVLMLRPETGARTVVLKNNTGNLQIGADFVMDRPGRTFALVYDGANWRPLVLFENRALHVDTTQVGTDADTSEKTLMSFSMPGDTLETDGALLEVHAWGVTGNNIDAKTVRLKFGGTTLVTFELIAGGANMDFWSVRAKVVRTGAATQDAFAEGLGTDTTSNINQATDQAFTTPAETLSGAVTLALTGQNGVGTANDIICHGLTIEKISAP